MAWFEPIKQVIRNTRGLSTSSVLKDLVENRGIDKLIIRLNTEGESTSQLFELGIDSLAKSLGEYAESTKLGTSNFEGKISKGQRIDHITLKDTGDFYGTWRVRVEGDTIFINANPNKDGDNLFNDFGEDIVGLTDSNLQILIDEIKAILPQYTKEKLLSGVV